MWRFLGGILSPIFPLWQQHWSTDSSTGSVWPCDFSSVIVQPEKEKSCSSTAGIVPKSFWCAQLGHWCLWYQLSFSTPSRYKCETDSESAPWLPGVSRSPFKGGGLLHKSGDWGWPTASFLCSQLFWCTLIDIKENLHGGKGKEHRKPVGTWRQYLPDGGQSCVSLTVREAALIIWIIRFFYTDFGFCSPLPTVLLSLMSLFQVWLLKPLCLHFPRWNSPAQSVPVAVVSSMSCKSLSWMFTVGNTHWDTQRSWEQRATNLWVELSSDHESWHQI